jgi:hypothetical protein
MLDQAAALQGFSRLGTAAVLSALFAEAETLRLQYGLNELESKSTPKWLTYLNMVRLARPLGWWAFCSWWHKQELCTWQDLHCCCVRHIGW